MGLVVFILPEKQLLRAVFYRNRELKHVAFFVP